MSNAWNKFVEKEQGGYLKVFFSELKKEIVTYNTSGSGEREGILLLNTRKGYWLYKIYEKEEMDVDGTIKVYSDRYVRKTLDFTALEGKLIYLVDDTLTHGCSLLETYELLEEKVNDALICPVVFAINDKVNVQQKRESASGISKDFWDKLKYYLLMSEDELGELCILETQLIHLEGIPNMIDLPFLKDSSSTAGALDFRFHLTKEQFRVLQRERKGWTFHFNTHIIEEKNVLQGFIIQMNNEQLLEKGKEFVHDLVMEGTYVEGEDGSFLVVFTPFAILKSMSKPFLLQLWNVLFDECEEYSDHTEDGEDRNRWIKYHRECVYALSMIITECFCKEVADEIGIRVEYDYDILKDHFPDSMIVRMQKMEKELKEKEDLLFRRLERMYDQKNPFVCDMVGYKTERKQKYNEDSAYKELRKMIQDIKDDYIKQQDGQMSGKGLTSVLEIGQMEKFLEDNYEFSSKQEKRYALTRVIVTILRSSVCSNKLEISQDGKYLIRGFRYGENSDLLLPFFDVYFYWAVILLISKCEMKGAIKCYETFVKKLKRKYEELKLLRDDAAEENFKWNSDYYKRALDFGQYVYNKFCFVQPYLQNQMSETKAYYMGKMEEFVEEC